MTQGRVALPGIIRCIRIVAPRVRDARVVVRRRPSSIMSTRRLARAVLERASARASVAANARSSTSTSTSTRLETTAPAPGAPAWSFASFSSAVRETRDALTLTDACARRLRALAEDDASNAGGEGEGTRLRLAVEGGGCSGFKYEFTLEREGDAEGGDRVFRAENGAEVVVDDVSYEFVRGATIDYVDEMIKSSFEVVKNPQADASCGCGASFGAKESAFGALGGQT